VIGRGRDGELRQVCHHSSLLVSARLPCCSVRVESEIHVYLVVVTVDVKYEVVDEQSDLVIVEP
jgi:hypothetical protein